MHTFYSDKHNLHNTDGVRLEGHPFVTDEVPVRARRLLEAVAAANFGPVEEPKDFGRGPIQAVHDAGFLQHLQEIYAESARITGRAEPVFVSTFSPRSAQRRARGIFGETGYYAYGVGSPILERTWEAAYWSAQCALAAAERVRAGERAAYALCRPPGHHAAADLYGGFCYLNNAAITARSLGDQVAILDIDYHHGNGTQLIFYDDPTVLFCSLHAHPDDDYPYYWGGAEERGAGAGTGFNRNWPLPQKTGDEAYLTALDEALAMIGGFAPRYLVVSAGFDTIDGDPVGGFSLSTDGLREIGRRIVGLGVPAVIVQEGGYLLSRLGNCATAFLSAFA
ncbi:MAG: histone deacetylase family protein [Anaerolineales bacterium]